MPKVLVVDDDADFRQVCRMVLEPAGFEVSEAGGPEEGLQMVQSERPDLLILDVLMPSDYEGFDLAVKIRQDLEMRDLPILLLTAVHEVKQVPYRFAPNETWLPVDIFLDKPASPKTLLQKVREALGMDREAPEEPL